MERLTVDEFMNKIENASAWDVDEYGYFMEPRLLIINGDLDVDPSNLDYSNYLGPDISTMSVEDYSDFHKRIRKAEIEYLKIIPRDGQD